MAWLLLLLRPAAPAMEQQELARGDLQVVWQEGWLHATGRQAAHQHEHNTASALSTAPGALMIGIRHWP